MDFVYEHYQIEIPYDQILRFKTRLKEGQYHAKMGKPDAPAYASAMVETSVTLTIQGDQHRNAFKTTLARCGGREITFTPLTLGELDNFKKHIGEEWHAILAVLGGTALAVLATLELVKNAMIKGVVTFQIFDYLELIGIVSIPAVIELLHSYQHKKFKKSKKKSYGFQDGSSKGPMHTY